MKIIKEYKKPTNVVITGQWVEGVEQALMITDDESTISVRGFDGKYKGLTTFGFVYILTEEEFNWFITSDHYKMHCDDDFGNIENMYIVLKDYVGTIGATGIMDRNKEFDNWDINDYFYHQFEDSSLILNVSGEHNITPMNVNEVKDFLKSNEASKVVVVTEKKVSLEEKIKELEKRVEAQEIQIAILSDTVDWCERNIK